MLLTASIFHISRCSLNDGPGIRTVVYFKGCNLSCRWCHNPEGQTSQPEILFAQAKCIGCGSCSDLCPTCHTPTGFDRTLCTVCGKCADQCTAHALEIVGKPYTPNALFDEIIKDEAYYQNGGGVTISGGECLLQAGFVAEFLRICKNHDIHTLIESAFYVPQTSIEQVLPYTDAIYVDCKLFDAEKHRLYTGHCNKRILQNIRLFAPKTSMTVRIPMIPNVNDDMENLHQTVHFAKEAGAKRVELLRFNPLGASKYETIGKTAEIFGTETQEKSEMLMVTSALNAYIGAENFVYCNI